MTTRQTLRDFLRTIGSTSTSISYPVNAGADGIVDLGDELGVEPNTGRDLVNFKTGESLLGDYTSFITQENDYPIMPGAHEGVSPQRGAAIPAAEMTSGKVFADSRDGTIAESLNYSNSMKFDEAGASLNTIVDKLGRGSAPDGNTLLSSTVSAAASSDVAPAQTEAVKGTFASLKKYNYYSPSSLTSNYAKTNSGNGLTPDEFESARKTRYQIGKGEYAVEETEVVAEITKKDLVGIARSMILKSAGWDDSTRPADAKDPDHAFDAISGDTLTRFPEIVRDNLGVVDAYRAQDSYGFPANPDGTSKLSSRGDMLVKVYDEANYTKMSGGTHAPDQPFGESPNSDNRIQSLQAGLSMLALAAIIDKKLINMSQIIKDLQTTDDTVLRGPYYMGRSTRSDLDAKTRALVRTFMCETGIYSYEKCVAEGLYSCFGYNAEEDRVTQDTDDYSTSKIASTYGNLVKKIANDLDQNFYDSPMGLSQGFWRATCESTIKIIKDIRRSTQQNDGADYVRCLLSMKDSLAVKVMNVFASLGYQRLVIQGISTADLESGESAVNPYGIDDYPSAPGTRQMKSRDGKLLSKSSLSWRNSALPSSFILPLETMKAALDADYMFDQTRGSNPIKGMLGSTLYDKTYVKATRNSGPIPPEVAKKIEDRLGAEYIPFYFRDLRTNEIVAFHAFLDSLQDGFTANYSDTKGFGRADSVKNYSGTSRAISLSFHIISTSKEDFDEMWYKINKLTSLVYPQYTRGRDVSTVDPTSLIYKGNTVNFEQPFSQLVGGTPVIRLRVGDLIKTNYTRSNLGRLFGVGNETFNASKISSEIKQLEGIKKIYKDVFNFGDKYGTETALAPFLAVAASPMELSKFSSFIDKIPVAKNLFSLAADAAISLGSDLLVNGFVNPALYANRSYYLNAEREDSELASNYYNGTRNGFTEYTGLRARYLLKPRSSPYQITINNKIKYLRLLRPIFVTLISKEDQRTGRTYEVRLDDDTLDESVMKSTCKVSEADLYINASSVVDITAFPGILLGLGVLKSWGPLSAAGANSANRALTSATNIPIDIKLDEVLASLGSSFISPKNNAITKAFEDRMGEGLAGVIKSLSFKWLENDWETDWNSRAPMNCHVTIGFEPIHDIAPGLDSNGFNRAPVYNVGQIMHDTFGHSRDDGGVSSQFFYKQGGAIAETAKHPSLQKKTE